MKKYSKNQLERYPIYLKYLKELYEKGEENISSPRMGHDLGYSEEQIRKDLQAVCNQAGKPKKGREISQLIETLESFLGYKAATSAILIGTGHLGKALLNYSHFGEMGLTITAGFDNDPEKIGKEIGGKPIYALKDLLPIMQNLKARIAIITVPVSDAQDVTNLAIKSGVLGIWNFAPVHLAVPEGIIVENVNLASSLAVLSNRINEQLLLKEE
jgi:redox-sensing transcriptional repressor